MKITGFLIFVLLLLSSCSPYPDYERLTSDIFFRLIQFEDKDRTTSVGDYITIQIQYRTVKDSVFFAGTRKIKVKEPLDEASIDHCFLKMKQGDSVSIILPAVKFFANTLKRSLPEFIKEEDMLKINVKLLEVQSEKEFQTEKQLFLKWSTELSEFEGILLKKYLKEERPEMQIKPEGFYMLEIKKGNGKKPVKGNHVWVHYEGKFLNGKFFDGTYRSKEPVDFIYGTQLVLISGLEQALGYMSEGEKAMIILPSELAFGSSGDEFGIIPPYTSLIYTLELLRIE